MALSRRALLARAGLAAGGFTLLAGCDHHAGASGPAPTASATTAAAVSALATAADQEARLVATYTRAAARLPALSAPLAAVRAGHRAHLAALRSALAGTGGRAPAAGAAPAAALPAAPAALLAALVALERHAQTSRLSGCLASGVDGTAAGLLASISAAEAEHAGLLSALSPAGGRS